MNRRKPGYPVKICRTRIRMDRIRSEEEYCIMKKHVLLAAALCVTAVMATACGSKNTQETTAAVEASAAETSAVDTTKPDLSNVDPKMAEGPGAFETDESSEGVQVAEISDEEMAKLQSQAAAQLEKTDYKSYAKEIIAIVKNKDMEGLADHIDFPTFVSCVKTNGGMVDTKEDFMKLDPAEIFSDEMEAAIEKVDVDSLEPVMAGIVLGDGAPNIILGYHRRWRACDHRNELLKQRRTVRENI